MLVDNLEEFETSKVEARRAFLKNCAKYAIAMPPAISLLVSAEGAFGQVNPQCSFVCENNFPPQGEACECPEDVNPAAADTDGSSDIELNNPEATP